MLSSFAAHQRAVDLFARLGDAVHDRRDLFRHNLAARDVISHEQRPRTHNDDVINDHAYQVLADGVVNIQRLRQRNLRAHTVSRGGQQRARHSEQSARINHAGEPAGCSYNGGVMRAADGVLHQFHRAVTGRSVHACCRVIKMLAHKILRVVAV